MLAGLLLLCLMAPRYWHHKSPSGATTTCRESMPSRPMGAVRMFQNWADYHSYMPPAGALDQVPDPLGLWAAPTIEELVAARTGLPPDHAPVEWPSLAPWTTAVDNHPATRPTLPPAPDPAATAAFQHVGRWFVDYSPVKVLSRLPAKIVDFYCVWSEQQAAPPAATASAADEAVPAPSTLRVLSAGERAWITPQARIATRSQRSAAAFPRNEQSDAVHVDPWCVPHTLLEQLQRLAQHPISAAWAEQTITQLTSLMGRENLDGNDVRPVLELLSDSAQQAVHMADETSEDCLRVELLRAHWGLARRLDCWTALYDIRLAEIARQRVALHGPLSSFFSSPSSQPTQTALGPALSIDLERYEQTRDPRLGRQVVQRQRALEASADSLDRSLADSIERHYRNANIRIAITAELLNRIVSQERSEVRALRDRIAGAAVRGQSHTQSASNVRLEPVEGRWQMTVEAAGVVSSNTLADGGAARLRSHSTTDFSARKSVLVDGGGVRLQQASVRANSRNRLVGVTTDFDWVPLVGSFTRDRAVSQYRARRGRAQSEIELRVSNEAVAQVDRETLAAVERVERQVRERFTDRLAEAGVQLTPIEMETTPERLVGRFRVAGDHQLGSHTPRPRALSDSLASLQVHETALTNAALTLALDGGRYTGLELQRLFREKFPRLGIDAAAARHDTAFRFAQEDALECHIQDGRLELTLQLAAVQQEGRTMRDFIVHAFYVPVVNGLEAELVRDGALGIEGRLSSSERARLHNVFNSVLPPERRLPILRLDEPDDPRLQGLMITQLVLEDGWLGLAIGPASNDRVAERSRSLR
jgi:hypothetical protein